MSELISKLQDAAKYWAGTSRYDYSFLFAQATDALVQKQSVIDDLLESVEEAKFTEPDLRAKLDKQRQRIEHLEVALGDLIKSCQAIIDNRHEDLGVRDDVEPYLKNRLMIARRSLPAGDSK